MQAGPVPDRADRLRLYLHAGLHVPGPLPGRRLPHRVHDLADGDQLPADHRGHLGPDPRRVSTPAPRPRRDRRPQLQLLLLQVPGRRPDPLHGRGLQVEPLRVPGEERHAGWGGSEFNLGACSVSRFGRGGNILCAR